MERQNGTDSAIAVLFFVLAVGALTEVVAGRAATTAEAPHAASWQAPLDTGHAARARGDAASARRAYLIALFRARGEGSLIGVLSAAEGFKALGDGEVVERALAMAAALDPGQDPATGRARLQALRDRLAATDALPMAVHVAR